MMGDKSFIVVAAAFISSFVSCAKSVEDIAHYANQDGDYEAVLELLSIEASPNESPEKKGAAAKYLDALSPKGKKTLSKVIFKHDSRHIQAYALKHLAAYKNDDDAPIVAKYLLDNRNKSVIYDNPDPLIEASNTLALYSNPEKLRFVKDIYKEVSDPDFKILLIKSLDNLKGEAASKTNEFLLEIIPENKKYPKVEAAIFETLYPEENAVVPTLRRAGHRLAFVVDTMVYGTKNLMDADLALQKQMEFLRKLAKTGYLESDTGRKSMEILYKGFLRLPVDYRTYTKPLREVKRNLEECLQILNIEFSRDIEVEDKEGGFLE
ncbi:MAG: hypothetical protein Kow0090_07170 [Myxococcota bacterium]